MSAASTVKRSVEASPAMAEGMAVKMVPAIITAPGVDTAVRAKVTVIRPGVRSRITTVVIGTGVTRITAIQIGGPGATSEKHERQPRERR
jgi:hypothetical protein